MPLCLPDSLANESQAHAYREQRYGNFVQKGFMATTPRLDWFLVLKKLNEVLPFQNFKSS